MQNPKISIITITYNSEKTLEETIKSIKSQNYDNLEYIIVDGGSKDSTIEIIKRYGDVVSKYISEPDEGISDAFNKGVLMAQGDIIGIINSDDMLCEGSLNKLASAYDGETDVYYGNAVICDEKGKRLSILTSSEDLSTLPYSFCIVHPATFVTKKAYEKYGFFDKEIRCAMDYDLLLRYYKAGAKFKYLDENLSVYRTGGTNMKLRKITIDEVRDVSVRYGGSPAKANFIRLKKILVDKLRPIQKFLKIKNKRVRDI